MTATERDDINMYTKIPLVPSLRMVRRCFSLLFFLPTFLFAFLFLILVACNGVQILCLHLPFLVESRGDLDSYAVTETRPISSSSTTSATASATSSSIMYAVKEEIPLSTPKTREEFLPLLNSSSSQKPKWRRKFKSISKILQQTLLSRRFSERTNAFLNTSCEVHFFMTWISSVESFGQRELFTVETIFKSHPQACLLIVSASMDSKRGMRLLNRFSCRGFRVAAISPDFPYIFRNTYAEDWFYQLKKGKINTGEVSIGQNLSNLLRLAMLYKYGGIYVDTDVIVMKSFSPLRNAIGAQTVDAETGTWSRLNNAVMIFDKKHPILFKFIKEFALTFNGNKWGYNGPYLVSRVVSRLVGKPGFNVTVLPPTAFYPVDWNSIHSLFHGPKGDGHFKWAVAKLRQIRKESFAVHLWNRQSRSLKVEQGSVIHHIMSDCCILCIS